LLFGPARRAAEQAGWGDEAITKRLVALLNAANFLSFWDDRDICYQSPPDEDDFGQYEYGGSLGPHPEADPQRRLHMLIADVATALQGVMGLVGAGGPTAAKPDEQPRQDGPFNIVLDQTEWKAQRGDASADFAGKAHPWRIFLQLCSNYPSSTPTTDLLDTVWGTGEGSRDALYAHMTAVREIITPLSVTVTHTRHVGYKLTEAPLQQLHPPRKKARRRPPRQRRI
jgi:hypothetical protein